MKYLLIVVAVALLVRIDWVIRVFEQNFERPKPAAATTEVAPAPEVALNTDLTLKENPRTLFFGFLKDFSASPSATIKEKILELNRANPALFTEDDRELASALGELRGQLVQRNRESAIFLIEFMTSLKGKNLDAARRVLVSLLDENVAEFLLLYRNSGDVNCGIAVLGSSELEATELAFELGERLQQVDQFLASEKADPQLQPLAKNCQLQLRFYLEKLTAPAPAPAPEATPAPLPETTPPPVPAPEGTSP